MHEAAIEHLTKADKVLARLIRKVGPCQLIPRKRCSPFQTLVQSVAHQQLNGTAAKAILNRVRALYPRRKFPAPRDVLATPDEKLRGAGLSRAKIASIKDIAAIVALLRTQVLPLQRHPTPRIAATGGPLLVTRVNGARLRRGARSHRCRNPGQRRSPRSQGRSRLSPAADRPV